MHHMIKARNDLYKLKLAIVIKLTKCTIMALVYFNGALPGHYTIIIDISEVVYAY